MLSWENPIFLINLNISLGVTYFRCFFYKKCKIDKFGDG